MIGDIIDYCFGGSSCNIAEGFVREHVAWYALQLVHNDEYLLIARENPPHGQASTNSCCYLMGAKNIPNDLTRATPIDNSGLEKLLSSKLGISENLFNPPQIYVIVYIIAYKIKTRLHHKNFYFIDRRNLLWRKR